MCDARAIGDHSACNNNFYHQYLQHHARMTQWIQNLHQNIHQTWQNPLGHTCCHHDHHSNQQQPVVYQGHVPQPGHYVSQPGHYVSQPGHYVSQPGHYVPQQEQYVPQQGQHVPQQGQHVPQQGQHVPKQGQHVPKQGQHVPQQGQHIPQQGQHILQQGQHVPQQGHISQQGYPAPQRNHVQHQRRSSRRRRNSKRSSQNDANHRSRSATSIDHVTNEEGEEDDGEWVFNVDAFLAFRAEKEESAVEEEAKSEESFELVDTILDENFEFVELDDAGQLQKIFGRPTAPDAKGDVEYDRESRIVLYGDRADRIAGLETSLEIMFDHLNDLNQPVVYPHV